MGLSIIQFVVHVIQDILEVGNTGFIVESRKTQIFAKGLTNLNVEEVGAFDC